MMTWEEADAISDAQARFREFTERFRRNVRGNLSTRFNGKIITVFRDRHGRFIWCILEDKQAGPKFSPKRFSEECEAIKALYREVYKQ